MSRSFEYLDRNFARHGLPVEPTAETLAVVWPRAPEAERLKLLMRAKAPQKAEFNKLKRRSAR